MAARSNPFIERTRCSRLRPLRLPLRSNVRCHENCIFFLSNFAIRVRERRPVSSPSDVVAIGYGTSYGMCIGYCYREIRVAGNAVRFVARGSAPEKTADGGYVVKPLGEAHGSLVLTDRETKELRRIVRRVRYAQLPDRLGCPDCADGGAAWTGLHNRRSPDQEDSLRSASRTTRTRGVECLVQSHRTAVQALDVPALGPPPRFALPSAAGASIELLEYC